MTLCIPTAAALQFIYHRGTCTWKWSTNCDYKTLSERKIKVVRHSAVFTLNSYISFFYILIGTSICQNISQLLVPAVTTHILPSMYNQTKKHFIYKPYNICLIMVAYASASSFQCSFTCEIWGNGKGKNTQKRSCYEQSRELLIYCLNDFIYILQ